MSSPLTLRQQRYLNLFIVLFNFLLIVTTAYKVRAHFSTWNFLLAYAVFAAVSSLAFWCRRKKSSLMDSTLDYVVSIAFTVLVLITLVNADWDIYALGYVYLIGFAALFSFTVDSGMKLVRLSR